MSDSASFKATLLLDELKAIQTHLSGRDHSPLGRTAVALERVLAILVSLAIAEGARMAFAPIFHPDSHAALSTLEKFATAFAYLAFFVTIIPFYHGGFTLIDQHCRYYARNKLRRTQIYLDFGCLFAEGLVAFLIATTIQRAQIFSTLLIVYFGLDTAWVLVSRQNADDEGERRLIRRWFFQSGVSMLVVGVLLVTFVVRNVSQYWLAIFVAVTLFGRAFFDYRNNATEYFDCRSIQPEDLHGVTEVTTRQA